MNITYWKWTFLLIAAIYLLPAWLVGCGALGAALGIWVAEKYKASQHKMLHKDFLKEYHRMMNEEDAERKDEDNQSNVINLKNHRKKGVQ